jgi:SHS2 domain-containing protein
MVEVLEHTADLGLRIAAADMDLLFAEAARGLMSLVVENPEDVQPEVSRVIELQARDVEGLLADWLTELLYLFDAHKLLLCRFSVKLKELALRAEVSGELIDPHRHHLLREIKAITYHGLGVRPTADGWEARVIVDI